MAATRTQFEAALHQLGHSMLEMGCTVDTMLEQALRAAESPDSELEQSVLEISERVGQLASEVESRSLVLIALEAPVSRDLRLIGTVMKIIIELKRIAEYAVDIAGMRRRLGVGVSYQPFVDLPLLAERARDMLRDAMAAFVNRDLALVDDIIARDNEVDELYHRYRSMLIAAMEKDTDTVRSALAQLMVAERCERVADHAQDIAERIRYLETGDMRYFTRRHGGTSRESRVESRENTLEGRRQ